MYATNLLNTKKNPQTVFKNQEKYGRQTVIKREVFLRSYYQPGKKFSELGKEKHQKNETALKLLIELQNRYPDDKDFQKAVELTREDITQNGKFRLD
ncbi:hypothetical protein [Chryseobacterium vrystaatense]|uniref:Uncharacterized protein n=1 Tax=Chryseobacterium vrystaatense TaxID=307480 RepID=A0A1M4ZFA0_9FLAO|nr:hypothetical protein [Chryseobacterium vrystaatense]SHF16739.1 hypothetical protein SAMN02787073_1582 [Chryseobacterium vrystaatense]